MAELAQPEAVAYKGTGLPTLTLLGHRRWTDYHRRAAQKQFDQFAQYFEASYRHQASLQFQVERRETQAIAAGILKERAEDAHLSADRLAQETKQRITEDSLEEFRKRLGSAYDAYHEDWARRFAALNTRTTEVVGGELQSQLGIGFNVYDPTIQAFIATHTNRLAGGVTDSTFRVIMHAAEEGWRNGEGIDQIQRRIRGVFDQGLAITDSRGRTRVLSATQRSRLIARTETTTVANGASITGIRAAGEDQNYLKSWISQGDNRVRQAHLDEEADSEEGIPINDTFANTGLDYPQEPNCRCSIIYLQNTRSESGSGKPPISGYDDVSSELNSLKYPKLADEQLAAVRDYRSNPATYQVMNRYLREGHVGATPEHDILSLVGNMDEAFGEMPKLKRSITTWRGAGPEWAGGADPFSLVGKTLTDAGYTSTSAGKPFARFFVKPEGAMFEIEIPEGQRGVWMPKVLDTDLKDEFVLPRGTTFSVKSVTKVAADDPEFGFMGDRRPAVRVLLEVLG